MTMAYRNFCRTVLMVSVVAMTVSARAADPESPASRADKFDTHPECMDRNTDTAGGDCIVHDKGTPRRHLPAANAAPRAPQAPSSAVGAAPASPGSSTPGVDAGK